MCASTRVLLAASAALLVAQAQDQCTEAVFGAKVGREVLLSPAAIDTGVQDSAISIPTVCVPGETQQGSRVRVCDADFPPRVQMRSLQGAVVHRTGQLLSNAAVFAYNYCI